MIDTDKANPDAINHAPLEPGPPAPTGSDPLYDPDLPVKRGWLGRIFGYGEQAKTMIVALALFVFSMILVLVLILGWVAESTEARAFVSEVSTPVFAIITGLIGYLTGRKS